MNILDYPDTDAVHPDDRAHAIILWLSLDSLDPFWRLSFPSCAPLLPTMRACAREALSERHAGRATSVRTAFEACLTDRGGAGHEDAAEWADRLLSADEYIEGTAGLGPWQGFLGQGQGDPDLYGLDNEALAEELADTFRAEVAKPSRRIMDAVRAQAMNRTLSDWDMEQHARYGENYHETGETDRSAILTAVGQLGRNLRFLDWMRRRVLTLPQVEQDNLHRALLREWGASAEAGPAVEMMTTRVIPAAGDIVA